MRPSNCPECGSTDIIEHVGVGELACRSCGLVLEDSGIEKDPYISHADKTNATHPFLAKAGSKGQDGRIIKESWLMSTKQKNLRLGMRKIDALAGKLSLPDYVKNDAKIIFKKAMDKDLAVGRDRLSINFASVYAACLLHGILLQGIVILRDIAFETDVLQTEYFKIQTFRTYYCNLG